MNLPHFYFRAYICPYGYFLNKKVANLSILYIILLGGILIIAEVQKKSKNHLSSFCEITLEVDFYLPE